MQVKGIGKKTIKEIKNHFSEDEYVSEYNPKIHIKPNSLVNGDMLEVMNGIKDKSIDLILTDLPYGTTACSWDNIIPFDRVRKQYNRVIKDDGAIVLFGSEPFSSRLRMSNLENYKYDWKWDKDKGFGIFLAKRQPLRTVEDIMVFYKKQCRYNPIMRKAKKDRIRPLSKGNIQGVKNNIVGVTNAKVAKDYNPTLRYPINLLKYSKQVGKDIHPTQKPVELLEYLIKTYTNEDEVVLDSAMGSGSTGVACKNTNRKFIGIELDKNYYNIAKGRIGDI